MVKLQGQNSASYDTEKYLKQVDAADRVVPSILDSVDLGIRFAQAFDNSKFENLPEGVFSPEIKIPATEFVPEVIIPEIRTNSDLQNLPEGVLSPEIKISATNFVPEIIVPEIRTN